MRRVPQRGGFTLIELMIVVAVLAMLAMIAIPKMADIIRKSNEAGTTGHLGSVRSALHIYFLDNEEIYPFDITSVLAPGSKYYSGASPIAYTVQHGRISAVDQLGAMDPLADLGGWGYVRAGGADAGTFWVECVHPDLKGKLWSQY